MSQWCKCGAFDKYNNPQATDIQFLADFLW